MYIQWGAYQNETAKGYVEIAIEKWNKQCEATGEGEIITEETARNLLRAMTWAFDVCTPVEAFNRYNKI